MCGIFAVIDCSGKPVSTDGLISVSQSIRHRGPDDEGYLLANTRGKEIKSFRGNDSVCYSENLLHIKDSGEHEFNLGFAFRRLSILDLTEAGHQPMSDSEGKVWIIFNGEIYNYIELREELKKEGFNFRSGSDTEVIIYAYKKWDTECFSKFNGMWGMVIYDSVKNKLICSRDRFGVKPLYLYADERKSVFMLSSELKAIISYLKVTGEAELNINESLLYDYFLYSLVDHTQETFLENIFHIEPSGFVTLTPDGKIERRKYFSLQINTSTPPYNRRYLEKTSDEFRELFKDAVRLRLRTDVPLGSCLSGGLDSSSIVCVINNLIKNDKSVASAIAGEFQKTFSAVYHDPLSDESDFIKEVVSHTGCDAHYIYPSGEKLASELEKLIYHLDEPFVSTSMYAQWNVMKLARENGVTVLLDGQGADEILAGYEVYHAFLYSQLARNFRLISLTRELLSNFSKGAEMIGRGLRFYIKSRKQVSDLGELKYFDKNFIWKHSSRNVLNYRTSSNLQERLYEDLTKYSLPNLLRYEDRNSMAFSIEARTPFLDWRLVKLAMETPVVYKIYRGWTKWLLRNSMKGILPLKILERKDKKGFPTPEKKWLMILKDEIFSSFERNYSRLNGIINLDDIKKDFDEILNNKNIRTNFIWKVYNYLKWREIFKI
ncbi:MAG: asparagine synthase (glutamine-hydrolyzing) [Ignavibacteria bacterium]|nr:asparagine synthase (glutamine-hydrolyzing) [Ignavibacteria bacterium]